MRDRLPVRARFLGHPLRPTLFQVPVVCFTGALISDFTYTQSPDMQWTNFAAWLLFFGIVFAGLALIAGFVDHSDARVRAIPAQRLLMVGMIVVFVLALFDNLVHTRDAWTSVVPSGITISAILAVVTWITAWFGNEATLRTITGVAERETAR